VKPGDLVTIGDNSGRISAMKTRYISVAAGDGREFLIPNEDLVTQKVTNWTYTDKNTLVKIAFSTNYDANPRQVCKLGIATAAAHPRATKGRTPNCILTEFAEAGMKFSLTFWIADPDGMDGVKSDVMLSLWDAFKQEGIKVPYPVRELRIRSGALPGRERGRGVQLTLQRAHFGQSAAAVPVQAGKSGRLDIVPMPNLGLHPAPRSLN